MQQFERYSCWLSVWCQAFRPSSRTCMFHEDLLFHCCSLVFRVADRLYKNCRLRLGHLSVVLLARAKVVRTNLILYLNPANFLIKFLYPKLAFLEQA